MTAPLQPENRRILVVDDNPSIHADFCKILCRHTPAVTAGAQARAALFGELLSPAPTIGFTVDTALQGAEALARVQQARAASQPYALAFVDIRMPPGWDGVETTSRLWQEDPDLQVVICTAYSDYSWEEMIRKLGASDRLVVLKKPFDNIEVLQLAHALTEKWKLNRALQQQLRERDELVAQRTAELKTTNEQLRQEIGERRHVEASLLLSEERFAKAFKANPIPMAIQGSRRGAFIDVNGGFERLTGYRRAELVGQNAEQIGLGGTFPGARSLVELLRDGSPVRDVACGVTSRSGEVRDTLVSIEPIELGGEPSRLVIAQDITEQLRLERQLRHSQKMEAVGELAAGIAHDFNNMLTVIQGNTSLILADRGPEAPDFPLLRGVLLASQRSAQLVRQLLTFGRKQALELRALDIGEVLGPVSEMLPRTLGEHIRVAVVPALDLPPITADAGMIEQMLMNLAINARDAMPHGGTLTIEAQAVTITPATLRTNADARPGNFLCLSVTDSGIGIAPDVLPRIFEPFFTTKPLGKGTGLGLATVYGIVKQHDGWIEVESQLRKGSTFRVYLPSTAREPKAWVAEEAPEVRANSGGGTILVVEDEDAVRDFVLQVLKFGGYRTYSAANGVQALAVWAAHQAEIDLLLTDVVMPEGMTGHELAQRLLKEKASLPVIFSSGYSPGEEAAPRTSAREKYLPKPYDAAALLRAVAEILGAGTQPPRPR